MNKVYLIEDDDNIRDLIIYALNNQGFDSMGFSNYRDLYDTISDRPPDLIILDIMLPEKDGYTILKELKSNKNLGHIPIIMLSAKESELDKVKGLDMGADDYITKPFGVMELISRIKAVMRRSLPKTVDEIVFGPISISPDTRKVYVDKELIDLTFKEFELLLYLIENKNIVLTRDQLMNQVWGFDFQGETRTIDVHIRTLRQKLKNHSNIIKTVRNVGYKVEV